MGAYTFLFSLGAGLLLAIRDAFHKRCPRCGKFRSLKYKTTYFRYQGYTIEVVRKCQNQNCRHTELRRKRINGKWDPWQNVCRTPIPQRQTATASL